MMPTTPFEDVDRLFDQMRRSMSEGRRLDGFDDANLELETDDDGYVVYADLPGYETDEIDLRFDDGTLAIDAVHETTGTNETRTRKVHEELRIPGPVAVDDATADYHNGVLEVRFPSDAEATVGHRIDVE